MTPAERIPQLAGLRSTRPQPGTRIPDLARRNGALELELERLVARVEELEGEKAALESFAAVAAHELIEPLILTEVYVDTVSERLDATAHADSQRELDILRRTATRMRLLLEALLHDARTAGRPLTRGPVAVAEVVAETVRLLAPELQSRGLRVEIGPLPEVHGERVLLSGLFGNLLVNALKYSPRAGGVVRIGATRTDPEVWRFFVESDGPAIPRQDRERIFEPFSRGRGERRARGSGLGLAICRNIVERHGGTIWVAPANGSGNRFYFTLPAR
jgi:signal transduction histidine kinase